MSFRRMSYLPTDTSTLGLNCSFCTEIDRSGRLRLGMLTCRLGSSQIRTYSGARLHVRTFMLFMMSGTAFRQSVTASLSFCV